MTLAATTTAAAAAAVWWTVAPTGSDGGAADAPAPSASRASPPQGGSENSIVCVGPDRVLRAPSQGESCPPGHQLLPLTPEVAVPCQLCDSFDEQPEPEQSGDAELVALERRIAALENGPYFEVVNNAGDPVFRIGPDGARFYNKQGNVMAMLGTSDAGGHFTARSGAADTKLTFGVSGTTAGLRVVDSKVVRMDLTTREGRSSLRMPSGNGLIAGLGESVTRSGAMLLGTRGGDMRVSFTVPESGGMITVNGGDKGGLSLSEARTGGGLLDLADARGDSVVRMGHVQGRYGIVLTGPVLGLPLVPKSGLPGSYFLGCGSAAPPACVPAVQ